MKGGGSGVGPGKTGPRSGTGTDGTGSKTEQMTKEQAEPGQTGPRARPEKMEIGTDGAGTGGETVTFGVRKWDRDRRDRGGNGTDRNGCGTGTEMTEE